VDAQQLLWKNEDEYLSGFGEIISSEYRRRNSEHQLPVKKMRRRPATDAALPVRCPSLPVTASSRGAHFEIASKRSFLNVPAT